MTTKPKQSGLTMYDGRKIRPMLEKLAKQHNKTYDEVLKVFIEEIDKPAVKSFEKAMEDFGKQI